MWLEEEEQQEEEQPEKQEEQEQEQEQEQEEQDIYGDDPEQGDEAHTPVSGWASPVLAPSSGETEAEQEPSSGKRPNRPATDEPAAQRPCTRPQQPQVLSLIHI